MLLLLCLSPKSQEKLVPRTTEYRPISLLGSIYKILAKTLVGRILNILPHIISNEQGAFVKGRQILDDILVANECVHSRYGERIPSHSCNLHLKRAYDRVNRKFLQYMLGRMGFGVRWRKWI